MSKLFSDPTGGDVLRAGNVTSGRLSYVLVHFGTLIISASIEAAGKSWVLYSF